MPYLLPFTTMLQLQFVSQFYFAYCTYFNMIWTMMKIYARKLLLKHVWKGRTPCVVKVKIDRIVHVNLNSFVLKQDQTSLHHWLVVSVYVLLEKRMCCDNWYICDLSNGYGLMQYYCTCTSFFIFIFLPNACFLVNYNGSWKCIL